MNAIWKLLSKCIFILICQLKNYFRSVKKIEFEEIRGNSDLKQNDFKMEKEVELLLNNLNLEPLIQLFESNEVTMVHLTGFTDEDLAKIGITKYQDRKILNKAIKEMQDDKDLLVFSTTGSSREWRGISASTKSKSNTFFLFC